MFKLSSMVTLSLALTIPYLASAENHQSDQETSFSNQPLTSAYSSDFSTPCRGKSSGKLKPLSVRDFEGEWAFSSRSVGGVSGADRIGESIVIDGQASFNKRGEGKPNFASGAIYSGVVGSVETFTFDPVQATLKISITDAKHGVGSIAIKDPSLGISVSIDFIAIRSHTGEVVRFEGHRTSVPADAASITSYVFVRQVQ